MFSKLNIQSRLMIPIIIMVVLVVSLIVLVQRTENKIADMNRAVDTAQLVSYEFAEIRSLSRSLQRDALNLIIEPDAGEIMVIRGKFDGRIAKMTEQLGHLRTRLSPAERTGLKGYFTSQWTVLKQLEAVSRLASSGHQTEALAAFRTGVRVAERHASKIADAQITAWLAKIDTLRSEAQSTGNQSRRNLVISSVVLSAIAVVVGFFITIRTVVSPLRGIQNTMARLAIGATEHSTPYLERRDEIGDMARAVEVFRTAMHERDLLRSEAEAAAAAEFERRQEASGAERQREEAHRREDERRREVAHAATLALAERFETTVGEVVGVLSSAATQLQSTAEVMSTTADLTMRQAANVAVASEQAAASVQTAATAGEELTSSIGEIHRQVSTSADVARATAEEARATDHTVAELAEAAEQVGRVIGMISSIAAQTNLLALNATIEAARAGEAGRGFAVVAAEVKELAAQTSKATQEVSNQIGSIQSSTGASVTALRSIGQQIARLDGISTAIASAVEQQAAASHEVARSIEAAASGTEQVFSNISEVSDAARETGAAATQVLASATELSKQAVTLRTQVGEFLTHVRAA